MNSNSMNNPYPEYHYADELRELISSHGEKVTYPPNAMIVTPEEVLDDFYFIINGRVRVTISDPDGKEKILAILGKDTFFGDAMMLTQSNDCVYLKTETPVAMYKIDKDIFWELVNSKTYFRDTILHHLATLYFTLVKQIGYYSFKSCKERLYELLVNSIDENDCNQEGYCRLKHRYSQMDLAKMIGANRFTVTKLINEFSEEGLIRVINNKIEVKKHFHD